ncbi:MAG: dTDP-4-dehydrorhamnose 3,5-epimerase [Rikenellaceae bacterium]
MKFNVIKTPIEGLLILEPDVKEDGRGFFMETYSKRDFQQAGIDVEFVQDNHSKSSRGVLRGLHFQRENTQGKLVRITSGAVLDVAVDLRPESRTYGASHSVELSAENKRMFWIPERFAHGFLTLENNTEMLYKCTDYYNPEADAGVIWNDQILCIDWQFERYDIDSKYLNISQKDKKHPAFRRWNPHEIWK